MQASTSFDDSDSPTSLTVTGGLTYSTTSTPQSFLTFPPINQFNMESSTTFKSIPMQSLISPPEATPYESFSFSRSSPAPAMAPAQDRKDISQFPSPPVSPALKIDAASVADESIVEIKDPYLYDQPSTAIQQPLFAEPEDPVARVVDEHISARLPHRFKKTSPPRRDEYLLALEFKSKVAEAAGRSVTQWYRRERQYLLDDRVAQRKTLAKIAPAPALAARHGVQKIRVPTSKPRATPATPRPPRPQKVRDAYSATPEPKRQHTGTTTREDKDFDLLPDRCPPLSTLPNKPNSLKVEWKGAPIDLRNDKDAWRLHPDEVTLAAILRLDCATYLTSKRRIFIARIECFKRGKDFRKTDSQQACKIDVNKASKLWVAFDRVGWFRKEHFLEWL